MRYHALKQNHKPGSKITLTCTFCHTSQQLNVPHPACTNKQFSVREYTTTSTTKEQHIAWGHDNHISTGTCGVTISGGSVVENFPVCPNMEVTVNCVMWLVGAVLGSNPQETEILKWPLIGFQTLWQSTLIWGTGSWTAKKWNRIKGPNRDQVHTHMYRWL